MSWYKKSDISLSSQLTSVIVTWLEQAGKGDNVLAYLQQDIDQTIKSLDGQSLSQSIGAAQSIVVNKQGYPLNANQTGVVQVLQDRLEAIQKDPMKIHVSPEQLQNVGATSTSPALISTVDDGGIETPNTGGQNPTPNAMPLA